MNNKKIGILAIQGGYVAHAKILAQLEVEHSLVVSVEQLKQCDALIIPGGESSTILKFITANGLFEEIISFHACGKPIFGTCAGAILLAKKVINPPQKSLGLINVTIKRNAYGRQLESHIATGKNLVNNQQQEMVFIRAPKIMELGPQIKVLATCEEEPVAVEENNCLLTTFHPELSSDLFWHKYFLGM
ncbi:MAG: pyridoxal 5'-phosphate synthase glutaminase subunit PdxT [Gammaproteobacteria bacterium]|jgi:5'-phosphate synthase pdxT subunit